MTGAELLALAGVVLSLLFEWFPGIKQWYDGLAEYLKRWFMIGLTFVVAASLYGLSCYTPYKWVSCDVAGLWELLEAWFWVLLGNQLAHKVFKRPSTAR